MGRKYQLDIQNGSARDFKRPSLFHASWKFAWLMTIALSHYYLNIFPLHKNSLFRLGIEVPALH